jgi:hypothetical protein
MGYTTEFNGVLRFKHELSVPQLAKLQTLRDAGAAASVAMTGRVL